MSFVSVLILRRLERPAVWPLEGSPGARARRDPNRDPLWDPFRDPQRDPVSMDPFWGSGSQKGIQGLNC